MEEENVELRRSSRSRSNTPFVRRTSDRENTHGAEETKHVTSTTHMKGSHKQRGGSRQKSSLTSVTESRTSETSITTHKRVQRKSGNDSDSSTEHAVEEEPKLGRRSDRQRAKRRLLVNGAMLQKTDEVLAMAADAVEEEQLQKRHHYKTSDYSSEEGEGFAYQIYKRAGDWWNKFPKTDYTYSPISPDRKEVAPGVVVMPNMSRRSLNTMRHESNTDNKTSSTSITTTSKNNLMKSRWFDPSVSGSQASRKVLEDWATVDSDVDDVAESLNSKKNSTHVSKSWTVTTVITSFFMTIWTFITVSYTRTIYAAYRIIGYPHETDIYATPRRGMSPVRGEESPSWLRRLFNWFYRLVCSVMQLDLLLLSSWHTTQTEQEHEVYYDEDDYAEIDSMSKSVFPQKRKTWRLLLLLLPLLFLAGEDHLAAVNGACVRDNGWWSMSEASEVAFNPLTQTTDIVWNTLLGWMVILFEAFGALKEKLFTNTASPTLPPVVLSPSDEDPQQQPAVDMETLAHYIMASSQFQQLLTMQVHTETQAAQKDSEHLESVLREQEKLNLELLREHQTLLLQLTDQLQQMEQKVDQLNAEAEMTHTLEQERELKWEKEKQTMKEQTSKQHLIKEGDHVLMRKELRELQGRLRLLQEKQAQMTRRCCQHNIGHVKLDDRDIENHILKVLADLLGATGQFSGHPEDLHMWVRNVLSAQDDLDTRFANLSSALHLQTREAVQRSKEVIMASVSKHIQAEFAKWQEEQQQHDIRTPVSSSSSRGTWATNSSVAGLTDLQVRAIVDEALAKYDADKTGLVDYALESSGGSVLNTRCTETYHAKTAKLSVLGIPFWYPSNTPRTVIQPGVHPGECWAFSGSQGFIVIKLSGLVQITAFSMEHIPRSLSPLGRIDSAPKDFSVWGLKEEQDSEPELLGKYMYRQNDTSLQYFGVQRSDVDPYEMVELRIESNHGNMEYTCLYRFRVHGVLFK